MELHVGIAITILNPYYHVVNYGNAKTIFLEMLICGICIILSVSMN